MSVPPAPKIVVVNVDGYLGSSFIPLEQFPQRLWKYLTNHDIDPDRIKYPENELRDFFVYRDDHQDGDTNGSYAEYRNSDGKYVAVQWGGPEKIKTVLCRELHKLLYLILNGFTTGVGVKVGCNLIQDFESLGWTFQLDQEVYTKATNPKFKDSLFEEYWVKIPRGPVQICAQINF
jgi:hypothetical protein